MISKVHGMFVLYCDVCGDTSEQDYDTYQDAVDAVKELDWIVENGEHICTECK